MIRIYRPVIKLLTERFSAKCNNSSSLKARNNSSNGLRVSLYNRKGWKTLVVLNINNNSKFRRSHQAMCFQSQNRQWFRSSKCLMWALLRISSPLLKDKSEEWRAAQVKVWPSNCCTTRMMDQSLHTARVRIPEESLLSTSVCQSEIWQTIIAFLETLPITSSSSRSIWRPLIRWATCLTRTPSRSCDTTIPTIR